MEKRGEPGRYLYCVVNGSDAVHLGNNGIDENSVYTISHKNISAVTHKCEAAPYETKDREQANNWILSHQYILDIATARFGTVIPLTFDTIFKGNDKAVESWLKSEYRSLHDLLHRLEGKSEFGVQVYLDKDFIDDLIEKDETIADISEQIRDRPNGYAYLLRKHLEKQKKTVNANKIRAISRDLLNDLSRLIGGLRIEEPKKNLSEPWRARTMILNLSCLLEMDDVTHLGSYLSTLNEREGYHVRFTGPWPPYSFVADIMNRKS